jgi:hypothetical protein
MKNEQILIKIMKNEQILIKSFHFSFFIFHSKGPSIKSTEPIRQPGPQKTARF